MTKITHTILPVYIVTRFTGHWAAWHVAAALGMMPDLIPFMAVALWQRYNTHWIMLKYVYRWIPVEQFSSWIKGLYNRLHRPWLYYRGLRLYVVYLLWLVLWPYGLHCIMDIPFHDDHAQGKNTLGMIVLEGLLWIVMIATWGRWRYG